MFLERLDSSSAWAFAVFALLLLILITDLAPLAARWLRRRVFRR